MDFGCWFLDEIIDDKIEDDYFLIPDKLVYLPNYIMKTEQQGFILNNNSQRSFLDYEKHNLERLIEN